jgi:Mrp family chromosome partitioning ATPase
VEETGPDGKIIQRMDPIVANGVKIMSMGFLVGADDPVIVRGPILHRTIEQFLRMTAWGELDYLIIDLPPGTGDIALTLSQLLGLTGAIVVCTPQQLALLDAVKAINMFRKVKIPVLGLIENMSGEIFGRGGAQKKAGEMGVPGRSSHRGEDSRIRRRGRHLRCVRRREPRPRGAAECLRAGGAADRQEPARNPQNALAGNFVVG